MCDASCCVTSGVHLSALLLGTRRFEGLHAWLVSVLSLILSVFSFPIRWSFLYAFMPGGGRAQVSGDEMAWWDLHVWPRMALLDAWM